MQPPSMKLALVTAIFVVTVVIVESGECQRSVTLASLSGTDPVSSITFPGSHNAGNNIWDTSNTWNDWAVNHKCTFQEQIDLGIRFFVVDTCVKSNGDYVFCHANDDIGFMQTYYPVEDLFTAIQSYRQTASNDVFFVRFTGDIYNNQGSGASVIRQKLVTVLLTYASIIYPSSDFVTDITGGTLTVGTVDKKIVVLVNSAFEFEGTTELTQIQDLIVYPEESIITKVSLTHDVKRKSLTSSKYVIQNLKTTAEVESLCNTAVPLIDVRFYSYPDPTLLTYAIKEVSKIMNEDAVWAVLACSKARCAATNNARPVNFLQVSFTGEWNKNVSTFDMFYNSLSRASCNDFNTNGYLLTSTRI